MENPKREEINKLFGNNSFADMLRNYLEKMNKNTENTEPKINIPKKEKEKIQKNIENKINEESNKNKIMTKTKQILKDILNPNPKEEIKEEPNVNDHFNSINSDNETKNKKEILNASLNEEYNKILNSFGIQDIDENSSKINKKDKSKNTLSPRQKLYDSSSSGEIESKKILGKKRYKNENDDLINKQINKEKYRCKSPEKKSEEKKEDSKINPFLNLLEQKNKDIYDINEIDEGFKIEGNIVSTNSLYGKKHSFVFANDSKKIKMDKKGEFIIKFLVKQENKWLALGLCDKEIVRENNYIFGGKSRISNGCFIVSTNNMVWHCFDRNQRKKIKTPDGVSSLQDPNNLFECKFNPSTEQLKFYVNGKFLASLFNVKSTKSEFLIPCLIFLNNCMVQTIFDYPN